MKRWGLGRDGGGESQDSQHGRQVWTRFVSLISSSISCRAVMCWAYSLSRETSDGEVPVPRTQKFKPPLPNTHSHKSFSLVNPSRQNCRPKAFYASQVAGNRPTYVCLPGSINFSFFPNTFFFPTQSDMPCSVSHFLCELLNHRVAEI